MFPREPALFLATPARDDTLALLLVPAPLALPAFLADFLVDLVADFFAAGAAAFFVALLPVFLAALAGLPLRPFASRLSFALEPRPTMFAMRFRTPGLSDSFEAAVARLALAGAF